MKIYLAGKIKKNDWRDTIVDGRGDVDCDIYNEISGGGILATTWPTLSKSIFDAHDYVGPYFVSCDHGCSHGANTHGVLGGGCTGEFLEHDKDDLNRKTVRWLCERAIQDCDLVFAWLDDLTAYGTLFELGFAKAFRKKIWCAWSWDVSDTLRKDFWFAIDSAERKAVGGNPKSILQELLGELPTTINYKEYILSDEWREKATAAKERAGWRCQVCNKSKDETYLDAHHRTYDRLGDELPEDITVLCRVCHGKFHGK